MATSTEDAKAEMNEQTSRRPDLSRFVFDEFVQGKDDIRYYFRRFELELRVLRITDENDKRDLLLRCMGAHLFKLVNDYFDPVSPDEKEFHEIRNFLEEYFKPIINIHAERTKFSQRFRCHGETISEYASALRTLAVNCKFKNTLDERLRDQLIVGINDSGILEVLFREHGSELATLAEVEKTSSNFQSALLNRETIESVMKTEHNFESNVNSINKQKQNFEKKRNLN